MSSSKFALLVVAAALLGWLCAQLLPPLEWLQQLTELLRTAFFAALKMLIAPLIFFSLLSGVMELRNTRSMGRLGAVTLGYYLCTTGIAITIGLIVVFLSTLGPRLYRWFKIPAHTPASAPPRHG